MTKYSLSTKKYVGDKATIELVGILGYYVGISMILNVFNVPLPDGAAGSIDSG